ncbi:hypothetical protein [Streptacidiphilus sp. PAMC 29251]
MQRWFWLAAVLLLAAFDVWCFLDHWSAVAGNTAASIIWTTPVVAAHHLVTKHRQDRHNAEQTVRVEAQAARLGAQQEQLADHRDDMAAVAQQVGELHGLHLHGTWPEDRHRDR